MGAWAVASAGGACLVIANLTREPVRVEIGEPSPQVTSIRRLDASTAARAARSPLEYRSASQPAPMAGEPLAPLDAYGSLTLWLDTMDGEPR